MAIHILNAIIILINAQFALAHTHTFYWIAHKTNNSIIQTKTLHDSIEMRTNLWTNEEKRQS